MAKFKRKRIGLIFAGGAALSHQPKQWEKVSRTEDARRWLEHVPELQLVADVEPIFVTDKNATEIGAPEWIAIAEAIRQHLPQVDGFVILHGLETVHYTANALSLMVQRPSVPVVLSASPIPRQATSAAQSEFGGRANIINAAQVATSAGGDVCVVFGNRVIQGSRAQVELTAGALQVTSIDQRLLGQVDFGTKFFPERSGPRPKPIFRIHIDPNVLVTTVMPGSGLPPAERTILKNVHGVVLRMHQGYFSLPKNYQQQLEQRAGEGMAVVVATPSSIATLPKSFIQLIGVSGSMAAVKTMWAIGVANGNAKQLRKLLLSNVAGEFTAVKGAA